MKLSLFVIISLISSALWAKPYCVAHRGNSSAELENTVTSIMSAAALNVTAIEFDIRHTKDNIPVLAHDENLERIVSAETCPRKKEISKMTYDEIVAQCPLKNGEKISTLEEALKALVDSKSHLFIEYKTAPRAEDLDLIEKYYEKKAHRLAFLSFESAYLRLIQVRKNRYSFLKDAKFLLLKKYASKKKKHLEFFDGMDSKYMTKRQVRKIQERGKLIGCYTKDKPEKILKYLNKGVDFITTNYPERCMRIIDKFNKAN